VSSATAPLHQKETTEVARAFSWCLLDTFPGRCFWHVPPGGDPEEDLGHTGGILSPGWPGNALVLPWKSWRTCLGRGKSGRLWLDCCPR